MKKMICLILLFAFLCGNAGAVSAQSAVVMDGDTGSILYERNGEEVLPMASTTKIMTCLIALEEGDIDRPVKIKREYTLAEGSSMYLKEQEVLPLRDILYGLMLASGNDAALAVAGECGGLDVFVKKMNDKAKTLGLKNTQFENPSGLDGEGHHTTAKELARLAAYALKNDTFAEIVGTKEYTNGTRTLRNHNKLLWRYDGAIGVKTGFTKKCGRCLVSAAKRNGRMVVAVTLNDGNDWNDHMELLDEAFASYKEHTMHTAGTTVREIEIIGGTKPEVAVKTAKDGTLSCTDAEMEGMKTRICGKKMVYAPVAAGEIYGTIEYMVGDTVLCEDVLVFSEASELDESQVKISFLERLAGFLKGLV